MILKQKFFGLIIGTLGFLVVSCEYFQQTDNRKVIVRVNDSYLYEDDVRALINENTSPEDSAIIVSNYITRWATQQLLIDRAELNLSEAQQKEFNDLVDNYRNELYTNAYTDALVSRDLDTSLSREEIENYYELNKENFVLNEDLVKLRYINLPENTNNIEEIRKKFVRFNEEDKAELTDMALQFKNYSMNDSVWVKTKSVYNKIGPLSADDRGRPTQEIQFYGIKGFCKCVSCVRK